MTKVRLGFLSKFFECSCESLKVNSIHSCHTEQGAVLKGVRGEGVIRCIPQTAAADLHALSCELADVDQDHSLISGNHEVLHTGSYHLGGAIRRMLLIEQKYPIDQKICLFFMNKPLRFIYLTKGFCHFLRPLYFIFFL